VAQAGSGVPEAISAQVAAAIGVEIAAADVAAAGAASGN
jgi:hypothetical protein